MDETRAPALDPSRSRTKTGWLWCLARNDRARGGSNLPGVVYFYAPGRGGEHAEQFFKGFDGSSRSTAMPATTGWPDRAAPPAATLGLCLLAINSLEAIMSSLRTGLQANRIVVPRRGLRRQPRRRTTGVPDAPNRQDHISHIRALRSEIGQAGRTGPGQPGPVFLFVAVQAARTAVLGPQ